MANIYNHNQLPFKSPLDTQIQRLVHKVRFKKAGLIIITGHVGVGKTTLAIHLADYINFLYEQEQINLSEKEGIQYSIGAEDFKKKFDKCFINNYHTCIYDEAGDFDNRRGYSDINFQLNRMFDTSRTFQIIPILILPDLSSLDKRIFRKGMALIHIYVNRRTEYADKRNYAVAKVYNLYRTYYLLDWFSKLKVTPVAYNLVSPNYQTTYYDLTKARSEQLDALSRKGKRLINAKTRGLYAMEDIAKELQLSHNTTRIYLSKYKVKPIEKIGRFNFYNKEQLQQLQEKLNIQKN